MPIELSFVYLVIMEQAFEITFLNGYAK